MSTQRRSKCPLWKQPHFLLDTTLAVLVFLSLGLFRPDFVVISVYILLHPYLLLTARKSAIKNLLLSSAVALLWLLIAHKEYGYNTRMFQLFGLNTFPLFAWALGLFAALHLFSCWVRTTPGRQLLFFTLFYAVALIVLESVAYHLFHIRNLAMAAYSGLALGACLHAPLWMKIAYFALGPIYAGLVWSFGERLRSCS